MIARSDTSVVSAPASAVRYSRAGALLRRLRRQRQPTSPDRQRLAHRKSSRKFNAEASPLPGCCWPLLNRQGRRHARSGKAHADPSSQRRGAHTLAGAASVKQVRFDTQPSTLVNATPKVMRKKGGAALSSKGLRLESASARSAFYSACSSWSRLGDAGGSPKAEPLSLANSDSASTLPTSDEEEAAAPRPDACAPLGVQPANCACRMEPHRVFDSAIPVITPPGVETGSYEELVVHARAMEGQWVTMLERSDSLDPQMVHVGIGKMKRMVMNRLAIPFSAQLKEGNTLLDCWISTPVGEKHTTASLTGQETEDKDADLGDWKATTAMVDYSCKWYCEGKPVRAMQQKRLNPKLGTAYETRTVLPDQAEGKVLLYNVTIHPPNGGDLISVDRVLKFAKKIDEE